MTGTALAVARAWLMPWRAVAEMRRQEDYSRALVLLVAEMATNFARYRDPGDPGLPENQRHLHLVE